MVLLSLTPGFSQVNGDTHLILKLLKRYIRSQTEHHRRVTFEDEYRAFLKRYEIKFDERYVWD